MSCHKNPGEPQHLPDMVSNRCSVVITPRAVVIVILCCNEPIGCPSNSGHLIVIQCSQAGRLNVSFHRQKQRLTNEVRCNTLRNNGFAGALLLEGGQTIIIGRT